MAPLLPASSLLLLLLLIFLPVAVHGVGVFSVRRKFASKDNPPVAELKKHDALRHSRLLFTQPKESIDLPLGGNIADIGMYYTQITIGTPPRNFTVQVDTGSGALWVNCRPCAGCTENTTIRVGKELLQLPTNLFETGDDIRKGTMIDSGTTFAYLPTAAFRPLLEKMFSNHPSLSLKMTDIDATFSKYSGRVSGKLVSNVMEKI